MRGGIQVIVKTLTGRRYEVDVDESDSVQEVKNKIEQKETIPVDQQRLIHEGKLMEENRKISEFYSNADITIYLVSRLRGNK